jgi:hypothetical protein
LIFVSPLPAGVIGFSHVAATANRRADPKPPFRAWSSASCGSTRRRISRSRSSRRKPADKVIILGNLTGLQCGETVDVSGHLGAPPFARPAAARAPRSARGLPSSVHGIRKYLGSGLIEGIGKTYADKIVARFGVRTFDIISNQSGRLREVDGIGPAAPRPSRRRGTTRKRCAK